MLLRKGWGALISFGVMAYLARMLDQADFGIVAISGTLINLVQVMATSGISEYLIFYKGEDEKKVINAGFWLNLAATVFVCAVVLVTTPYWASFYNDERIPNIVYLLLIGFFFSMFSAIPVALFRKNLDYQPMIFIQTVFGTISNVSQIGFAYYGFGVYSLALPNALIAPLLAIALYWRSGFSPRLQIGFSYWKKIFQYTKHVIGQRIMGKLVNEGDTLIIGKFFGMQVLGVYNLAFQFANLFTAHLLPIITNISMPVFAKNNHDTALVTQHYHKMIRIIAYITVPVIVLMILNAEFLITTIYGMRWKDAVLPFQVLSLFVIVRSIGSPTSGLYNAMGKPQIGLYFTLVFTPIFLLTIYWSSLFSSLTLLVIMISALRIVGSFTHFILSARLLGDRLSAVLRLLLPPFISAGIAYAVALIIPPLPEIYVFARVIIFLLVFWCLLKFLWNSQYRLFVRDINSMLPEKIKQFSNTMPF